MTKENRQYRIKVGLVDGGIGASIRATTDIFMERDFLTSAAAEREIVNDYIGHGDAVAKLIIDECPQARLILARVFGEHYAAPIELICSSILWLAEQEVELINLSFGTLKHSQQLERVCREASSSGVLLVCSSPARGGLVFPAAFDCCVSVTGDARCSVDEISWLGTPTADFGAHPYFVANQVEKGGGASYAAARFTGRAASLLAKGISRNQLLPMLGSACSYFGPERKVGYGVGQLVGVIEDRP